MRVISHRRGAVPLLAVFISLLAFGAGIGIGNFFLPRTPEGAQVSLISPESKEDLGVKGSPRGNFLAEVSGVFQDALSGALGLEGGTRESIIGESSEENLSPEDLRGPDPLTLAALPISLDEDRPSEPREDQAQELVKAPTCNFLSNSSPLRTVLISEVAWMGGEKSANDEWIELYNPGASEVSLAGWQIVSGGADFRIEFGNGEKVSGSGYFLLERTDDDSVPAKTAGKIYSGALSNSGTHMKMFDQNCRLIDEVNGSGGWSLGGDADARQTLARNLANLTWYTQEAKGGTPAAPNGSPKVAAVIPSSSTNQTSTSVIPTSPIPSPTLYLVSVSMIGDGTGRVSSLPSGINCGTLCQGQFSQGVKLSLSPLANPESVFTGWSGACTGGGVCEPVVDGNLTIVANFSKVPEIQNPGSTTPPPGLGSTSTVVITEIMAGSSASADYEFIELYNKGSEVVNLTGWTIKKKTSTGSESTLVSASRLEGKVIPPGKYFLVGHETTYSGPVTADATWASSYNIAYSNNAILLYDGSGLKIEEVGWVTIPKDESYIRSSLDGTTFELTPSPTPRNLSS